MKGPIKWMAGNHVASNILMLVFVVGGVLIGRTIKQEVFPEFEMDMITVSVAYPGATPLEVEDGIVRPIENAVSSVNNIKQVDATASEGVGQVTIELIEGTDPDEALNDVKSEIDRILTFPENAEEPVVSKVITRHEVITLVVYGDASERALKERAEAIRDELLAKPNITQVELSATRPYEISIDISEENLQRYNLTLDQVAQMIRQASLDMPGGSVKTKGGEVMIRTREKRFTGAEYALVVIRTQPDGSVVTLGDIAEIHDTFTELDREISYNGKPAAMVQVFRVGDQTPKDVSRTVRQFIAEYEVQLPPTVQVDVFFDWSDLLNDRMNLLFKNGFYGLILVFITLALFLEIRLALWVASAILVSFLGALLIVPAFDVSINMLSLFAFILVLGLVVDDAIIIGENIYTHRLMGKSLWQAAVDGATEVSTPVTFAIMTTIAAFSPLLFVTGVMGKFMGVIPTIVITVLTISLIESLFILPAHLNGRFAASRAPIWQRIERLRSRFDVFVRWMIDHTYAGTLRWTTHYRYTTLAIALSIMMLTIGLVGGGFIKFVFMAQIESDQAQANITLAPGTPFEETKRVTDRIREEGLALVEEYDAKRTDGRSNLISVFSGAGMQQSSSRRRSSDAMNASNQATVMMMFEESDVRNIPTPEFASRWRERVGEIPGAEEITYESQLMRTGKDIDLQLSHTDFDKLLEAVERLKQDLSSYAGVSEVADSYSEGKRELQLTLRPEARSLGITEQDLASQVRSAFYGAEALRLQRGRDEVKVMVRYPESERRSLADVEDMRIRTPMGGEIPFYQAANVDDSRGYSVINRTDRRRVVNVTAAVDRRTANSKEIIEDVEAGLLQQLVYDYPGLGYDLEGEAKNRQESMASLIVGFAFALFLIYALLAVPFRSYLQPLVVMSVIPFGIVGAVLGHILFGYNLSMLSMFGIVALSGVVVNDSLVMIDFVNRARASGTPLHEAVIESGKRRFRPIILTSLTTFFGLLPMITETSIQARFMIPMAISLGFGVLFATGIALVLVPTLYTILEDILRLFGWSEEDKIEETVSSQRAAAATVSDRQ